MRIRSCLAGAALSAVLLSGVAVAAPAQAAEPKSDATSAASATSQDSPGPEYSFQGYYSYYNDCTSAGAAGKRKGWWTAYACTDGSWLPGDDWELWAIEQ